MPYILVASCRASEVLNVSVRHLPTFYSPRDVDGHAWKFTIHPSENALVTARTKGNDENGIEMHVDNQRFP